MIDIKVVLAILFIHWFADFVLQTDWEAKNKSKSNSALFQHVFKYSLVWVACIILVAVAGIVSGFSQEDIGWSEFMWLFPTITLVCHFATDYVTSRINSKLYAKGKIHEFFVSVGFDQFLHFAQLLLTYQLLSN